MILCIPSRHRAKTWLKYTGKLFPEVPVVICEDDVEAYEGVGVSNLWVRDGSADPPRAGKAASMSWVMENLVPEGEWVGFMDDDLYDFTQVHRDYYDDPKFPNTLTSKERSRAFAEPITDLAGLLRVLEDTIEHAESVGATYCGLSNAQNPFFRMSKWGHAAWVQATLCLMKNVGQGVWIRHDEEAYSLADALGRDGIIVVNRYATYQTPDKSPGGLGEVNTRIEIRREEHAEICERWPGLMKQTELPYVWGLNKQQIPDYPMLRLAHRTEPGIKKWRQGWIAKSSST